MFAFENLSLDDIVVITSERHSDYDRIVIKEMVLVPLNLYLSKKTQIDNLKNFYKELDGEYSSAEAVIDLIKSPTYNNFHKMIESHSDYYDFSDVVSQALGVSKDDLDNFTENFLVKFKNEEKILSDKEVAFLTLNLLMIFLRLIF